MANISHREVSISVSAEDDPLTDCTPLPKAGLRYLPLILSFHTLSQSCFVNISLNVLVSRYWPQKDYRIFLNFEISDLKIEGYNYNASALLSKRLKSHD